MHELMGWPGPMTERQFVTWIEWLNQDLNRPSRADWYALKIARSNGDKSATGPLHLYGEKQEISEAEQVAHAKARARARSGVPSKVVKRGNDGAGG